MPDINLLAVLVAGILSFAVGGLWYSPILFGNAWLRENGFTQDIVHGPKVFILALIFALIAAIGFDLLLPINPSLLDAIHLALLIGLTLVATSYGINYQFSQRSTVLWAIDSGYHLAQFLVYGLVFGLWPS